MTIGRVAYDLWAVFLVSWAVAGLWVSKARKRESGWLGVAHFVGFAVGFALLFTPSANELAFGQGHVSLASVIGERWLRPLWSTPALAAWVLVAVEAAAFAFGWWARAHIGALWSGAMVVREGHRVVDTGPYGIVRHPIYTAFIAASWTLALIAPTPMALAGAVVLTAVMAIKARQEEDFLRRELGAAAYDAYAAHTPMLIPFAPR